MTALFNLRRVIPTKIFEADVSKASQATFSLSSVYKYPSNSLFILSLTYWHTIAKKLSSRRSF